MSKITEDPRIDPRIKTIFGAMPDMENPGDVSSREKLLERANSPENKAMMDGLKAFFDMNDTEEVSPSKGLKTYTEKFYCTNITTRKY